VSDLSQITEDSYTTTILGQEFGYRLISRKELKHVQQLASGNAITLEDLVCNTCVISTPETFPGWDDCLAGVPSELAKAILDGSGFLSKESMQRLEEEAAQWAMTQDARFDALITFCHPTITDEDLDTMSPKRWHLLAAKSQLIVAGLYGIDTTDFLDPSKKLSSTQPQQPLPPTPQGLPQAGEYGVSKLQSHVETEGAFSFTK